MTPNAEAVIRAFVERYVTLNPAEWCDVLCRWTELTFAKNEYLTREGETEQYFYLVLDGVQRLAYAHEDNEVVLGFSYDNSPSGIFDSFMYQQPAVFNLRAITDSRLVGIPFADLQELFDRYKSLERWGRLFITEAAIGRGMREVQLLTLTAEERYLRLLQQSPRSVQLIPGKLLASYLNMTPETFSRMRRRLLKGKHH